MFFSVQKDQLSIFLSNINVEAFSTLSLVKKQKNKNSFPVSLYENSLIKHKVNKILSYFRKPFSLQIFTHIYFFFHYYVVIIIIMLLTIKKNGQSVIYFPSVFVSCCLVKIGIFPLDRRIIVTNQNRNTRNEFIKNVQFLVWRFCINCILF